MKFFIGCAKIAPLVILFWLFVCALAYAVLAKGLDKQSEEETQVYNCGNPEGLTVQPSGRIIEEGEVFTQIGYETVDEAGVSSVQVYDGTITGTELFICEVTDG
jgi:hypothetical protein